MRRNSNRKKQIGNNNIFNTGRPLFEKQRVINPIDIVEVNGNNVNLQKLPEIITRNDIYGETDSITTIERILAPNMPVGTVDITFPLGATTMQIASTSANDTFAGTGAQIVAISGLDVNFRNITETLNMNGQTPVSTTLEFLRIQQASVRETGSSDINEGNLFVTDTADTFVGGEPQLRCYDSMAIGDGFSKTATFTVSAGRILIHQRLQVSTDATGNERVIARLKVQGDENLNKGVAVPDVYYIENHLDIDLRNTRRRIPRQDMWLTVQTTSGTAAGHFRLTTIQSNISESNQNLLV